jgi:hypothetical protein
MVFGCDIDAVDNVNHVPNAHHVVGELRIHVDHLVHRRRHRELLKLKVVPDYVSCEHVAQNVAVPLQPRQVAFLQKQVHKASCCQGKEQKLEQILFFLLHTCDDRN